jgi:small subunit ribosomal protein S20
MPHTRSARKNLRKGEKRRLHNRAVKKSLKTYVKNVREMAAAGKNDDLVQALRLAVKKLDKAAAKRIIHPNLAARQKSQLARLLNRHKQASTSAAPKR